MAYLITFHWGWLAGGLLLGLAMGWIAVVQHGDGLSKANVQRAAVLVAVLLGLAIARVFPGRWGYWLDLGLLMLTAYVIGCVCGSWLRDRFISRQAPIA